MVGGAEIPLIRLSHTEWPPKKTQRKMKMEELKRSDAAKCHKPERNS